MAIGPELEHPAVMAALRIADGQHRSAAGRIRYVSVSAELVEVPVARLIVRRPWVIDAAVDDVEEMVLGVIRREGDREQAVIAEWIQIVDEWLDVEECADGVVFDEPDPASLLDNEKAIGI